MKARHTRQKRLAVAALVFASGVSAHASSSGSQLFHYWTRIPQTARTCQDEAQALGERFAESVPAASVVESKCLATPTLEADGTTFQLYSLDVDYMASYPSTSHKTYLGLPSMANAGLDGGAPYLSFQVCSDDIAAQTKLYEAQTGLVALSATCAPVDAGNGYFMTIEGFGDPEVTLHNLDIVMYGETNADYVQKAMTLIADAGGKVARFSGPTVLYYSSTVNVSHQMLFGNRYPSQCTSQLEDARAIFQAAGATEVTIDCLPSAHGDGLFWMEAVYNSNAMLMDDLGMTAPKYYSFEECMGDRDRVLSSVNGDILGGLCVPNVTKPGRYQLQIYKKL